MVWGVSFGHHDAALTILQNDQLLYASHSERYSRMKNDPSLHPLQIQEAFAFGVPEKIYFYENTRLKKWRYLRSGEWFRLKENPEKNLRSLLQQCGIQSDSIPFIQGNHHLSHAAAGFYCSGFDEALIVVCDAIGETDSLVIYEASKGTINPKPLMSMRYPHSVGLFYSAVTKAVGLKPNEEEYILMGMSAYGDPKIREKDLQQFVELGTGQVPTWKALLNAHKGLPIEVQDETDQMHWAAAAQALVEKHLLRVFQYLQNQFPENQNWIFAGGVALNCVLNTKIADSLKSGSSLFIFPNPGDAGSALGAVLGQTEKKIAFSNCFLGTEIPKVLSNKDIAEALLKNKVIGLARGRAEFGPRALGARSLLADPRGLEIKDLVNQIKKRQNFRPFAAAVLQEHAKEHFLLPRNVTASPFMQFVAKVKRSDLYPAICHVDQTSRIQTVSQQENPDFYELLQNWLKLTGCPFVLNTSLNIRGEPLVNNEEHRNAFASRYQIPVFS